MDQFEEYMNLMAKQKVWYDTAVKLMTDLMPLHQVVGGNLSGRRWAELCQHLLNHPDSPEELLKRQRASAGSGKQGEAAPPVDGPQNQGEPQ